MTTLRRTLTDTLITDLDLKEMDSSLLARALLIGARNANLNVQVFEDAICFAAYVHRAATRAQRAGMPRVHYLEHPLRVTLRLMRYGCTDQVALLAAILHDTVEDNACEIVMTFTGVSPANAEDARALAIDYIASQFGADVADVVLDLCNPFFPRGMTKAEKHVMYRAHVTTAIVKVRAALVKFSDFVDNAFSLGHTVSPSTLNMVRSLVSKYSPLVPVFETRLSQLDVAELIPADGRRQIREHIAAGRITLAELASI